MKGCHVEINEKHHVFLLPKRAAIGRVLFTLCQSEGELCYPTKIHRIMTDPSYATVYDAIQQFKDHGWITQTTNANAGRKNPITPTEDGTTVFTALVDFMEVLDTHVFRS